MGGRANGSGGPGLLLASSGAEKRRILVDRQDYEAGIQSDHQAWEEEINRRYPTRENYTAPKEVRQPAVPRDEVTQDAKYQPCIVNCFFCEQALSHTFNIK